MSPETQAANLLAQAADLLADSKRLTAAAPDLLLIVGDLLHLHIAHHNHPTHARARKLINQIKGRQ